MQNSNVERSKAVETMLAQLKNPFDPKFVKCRVGATSKDKKKGIALFYVDAREVMKRLDDVCGMDGWQRSVEETPHGCVAELSIRMPYTVNGEEKWVTKSDTGEFTKTSELKGASSDAFKRAAVNFGVGRYLYYIPNQWFPINEYKQFVETPTLPVWATPNKSLPDWEAAAIAEYDQKTDIGLDEVDFVDKQAEEEFKTKESIKADIEAALRNKMNND